MVNVRRWGCWRGRGSRRIVRSSGLARCCSFLPSRRHMCLLLLRRTSRRLQARTDGDGRPHGPRAPNGRQHRHGLAVPSAAWVGRRAVAAIGPLRAVELDHDNLATASRQDRKRPRPVRTRVTGAVTSSQPASSGCEGNPHSDSWNSPRSWFLRTFPNEFRGSASTKRIERGRL